MDNNGVSPAVGHGEHGFFDVAQTRDRTCRHAVIHGDNHGFTGLPVNNAFQSYALANDHFSIAFLNY
jgi:hypothetical protein